MNKKIIAAATAALLAGTMNVQADATVFGMIDMSLDFVDDGTIDTQQMNSNTSNIGVKGSEDLGNGMSAIYMIDFQINSSTVAGPTDRDQWVGLKGDFGKVRFGTISNSYKSHGAMIDPLYRTSAQARGLGVQSGMHNGAGITGARMTKHVRYDNNFSGLNVTVDYSFGDTSTAEGDNPYGFGASYDIAGGTIFADYLTSDAGGNDDAWKIGGKYAAMEGVSIYAQYENDGGMISGGGNDMDWTTIGATMAMGNTTVIFQYGMNDDDSVAAGNQESSSWTLAAAHSMSKRTMAYAGFAQVNPDAAGSAETDVFTVGLRHKF